MVARFDTSRLPTGIWFVRSGKGQGVMPVTPEGRRVTRLFLAGMFGSGLLAGLAAWAAGDPWWLLLMAIGMVASAIWFVRTAFRHADRTINYRDLMVKE